MLSVYQNEHYKHKVMQIKVLKVFFHLLEVQLRLFNNELAKPKLVAIHNSNSADQPGRPIHDIE